MHQTRCSSVGAILQRGVRVLLTEMLLPLLARLGTACLVSTRGQTRHTGILNFELELHMRNSSSMRPSNRTMPHSGSSAVLLPLCGPRRPTSGRRRGGTPRAPPGAGTRLAEGFRRGRGATPAAPHPSARGHPSESAATPMPWRIVMKAYASSRA